MIEEDSLVACPEFSDYDIDHMCRVCLQDGVLKSVFSDDEVPKLSQKINECASVQVQKGDGLPENICDYCISELNLAYYFRNQCRLSDSKLRRAFLKNKHNDESGEIITGDLINISNNNELITGDLMNTNNNEIITDEIRDISNNNQMVTDISNETNETTIPNHEQVPLPMQIDPLTLPKSEPITEPTPEYSSLTENACLGGMYDPGKNTNGPENELDIKILNVQAFPTNAKLELSDEEKFLKHSLQGKFKCEHCDKTFLYISKLKQHQATHSTERPYKCEMCDKTFSRKDTLHLHKNTHTNNKPYSCDQCVANFKRRNSLNKHYYIHTNVKQYKCEICCKSFGRRDNFNVHMKSLHSGDAEIKEYKCSMCPKSFKRSDVFSRHTKTHEQFKKKYICAICLKTYSRADVLRAHLKQHVKKFESQQ